jgi:hypothetical protein
LYWRVERQVLVHPGGSGLGKSIVDIHSIPPGVIVVLENGSGTIAWRNPARRNPAPIGKRTATRTTVGTSSATGETSAIRKTSAIGKNSARTTSIRTTTRRT